MRNRQIGDTKTYVDVDANGRSVSEGRDATRTFHPMAPIQAIEGISAAIIAAALLVLQRRVVVVKIGDFHIFS